MRVGAITDKGKVREHNEDTYGYHDSLFVLADGMGGHQAGEIASAIAVETILNFEFTGEIENDLKKAVAKANQAILLEVANNPERFGMGTTIAVLYLDHGSAYLTHIGDSRIYKLSKGQLRKLTEDHSLVAELVRNGGITENEAKSHPQRNVLTKALGTAGELEPVINIVPISEGDKFLICSDGLTGLVDEETVTEKMSMNVHPQRIAEELVCLANEHGGIDNTTIIVVEI